MAYQTKFSFQISFVDRSAEVPEKADAEPLQRSER
jgi:hypothetical protein